VRLSGDWVPVFAVVIALDVPATALAFFALKTMRARRIVVHADIPRPI
jgi:hypothetical protein